MYACRVSELHTCENELVSYVCTRVESMSYTRIKIDLMSYVRVCTRLESVARSKHTPSQLYKPVS